jgi:hypothetical protein
MRVRVILAFIALAIGVQNLRAQSTSVTVPAAAVNKQTTIAVAQFNINTKQDYAAVATMAYVNTACKSGNTVVCPSFPDEQAAAKFLQDTYNTFRGQQPPKTVMFGLTKDEILKYTIDQGVKALAATHPATKPFGDFAAATYDLYKKGEARRLEQESRTKALFQSYDNFTKGTDSRYASTTISTFIDVANTNPLLKRGADVVFGASVFGGQLDDGAQNRISNTPQFATWQAVQQLLTHLAPNGDLRALITQTNNVVNTNFQAVLADLSEVKGTLSVVVDRQRSILAYIKNQQDQQALQALAAKQLQEKQLRMEAASSTVYLLSSFIGFSDPDLGKQVSVAGNAAIHLVSSITKFNDFASRLKGGSSSGSFDEATALGTLVLTGNIFGSAMQIVSLFSDSGPSPDQIIMQQLQQISQQIIELSREMNSRFDRVDQSLIDIKLNLSQIYNGLTEQLASIAAGVGRLEDKVQIVESKLSRLQSDLGRMEHEIHSNELDIYRQPLLLAINNAVGHKERTGADMPYSGNAPSDYVNFESTLHTWATQLASQGIDAPMPTAGDPKFSDDQLAKTFSLDSLALYGNYLNVLPQVKFNLPQLLPGAQLPNIEDWARSAQAYVEIAREQPMHDRRFPQAVNRLAEVRAAGKKLQDAMRAVTIKPDGSPNMALFSAMKGFYSGKAEAFVAALEAYKRKFEAAPGVAGFDLWGDGSQQSDPPRTSLPLPLGGMGLGGWMYNGSPFGQSDYSWSLSPPPGFEKFVSQAVINMAALTGKFELRWSASDGNVVSRSGSCVNVKAYIHVRGFVPTSQATPPPNPPYPTVDNVFWRSMRVPDLTLCSYHPDWNLIRRQHMRSVWESGIKNSFSANSEPGYTEEQLSDWPTAREDLLREESRDFGFIDQTNNSWARLGVEYFFSARKSAFYNKLLADLESSEPLRSRVEELSGASALIKAFTVFGLHRTLDSNELVRALVVGQERVPDRAVLTQLMISSAAEWSCSPRGQACAPTGADPSLVKETLLSRHGVLFNELDTVLAQIASGSRVETSPVIDNVLSSIDTHARVRLLPFATDVTGSVQITKSGFRYNSGSKSFVQTIAVKNVGTTPINGPINLVLDILRSGTGETDVVLTNATGQTVVMAPLGSPFVTLELGALSSLPVGATSSATLTFGSRSQTAILYQTRVLSGNGFR